MSVCALMCQEKAQRRDPEETRREMELQLEAWHKLAPGTQEEVRVTRETQPNMFNCGCHVGKCDLHCYSSVNWRRDLRSFVFYTFLLHLLKNADTNALQIQICLNKGNLNKNAVLVNITRIMWKLGIYLMYFLKHKASLRRRWNS